MIYILTGTLSILTDLSITCNKCCLSKVGPAIYLRIVRRVCLLVTVYNFFFISLENFSNIHGLVACGGEDGAVECFDMRKKSSVGRISTAASPDDIGQASVLLFLS